MELDLLPVLNYEGKRMPVALSLTLTAQPGDTFRILGPVALRGQVFNAGGGFLELTAQGQVRLEFQCARCAESFVREHTFPVEERLKKESPASQDADDPDVTVFMGSAVPLDELIYGSLYMSLPTRALCREDCKGLCPQCGRNLNQGPCGCKEPTDPRFDVLDQLL